MRAHILRTIAASVLVYAALIGSTLFPDCEAVFIKAFGEHRFGISGPLFFRLLLTVLFLPYPLVFWHLIYLIRRTIEGRPAPDVSLLEAGDPTALDDYRRLENAKAAVSAGGLYFVLLVAAWIIYTTAKGI